MLLAEVVINVNKPAFSVSQEATSLIEVKHMWEGPLLGLLCTELGLE